MATNNEMPPQKEGGLDNVKHATPTDNVNVDRMQLFEDFNKVKPATTSDSNLTSGLQNRNEPDQLVMTDAFAGVTDNSKASLAKTVNGTNTEATPDKKDANKKADTVNGDNPPPPGGKPPESLENRTEQQPAGSDTAKNEPFKVAIQKPEQLDKKAPTAVFLDNFTDKEIDLGNGTRVEHGEVSRRAAEAAGFNTVGLDMNLQRNSTDDLDFSKSLKEIDRRVTSGEMPLGKGDVVNVSMGNNDPTFKKASEFLGMDVNAGNLAEQKDKILDRMREISGDPTRSQDDRDTAKRVVDTNDAIKSLQDKGIEVVHASGNTGPDRFSWDFMNAKTQLASATPGGRLDSDSAFHSLTQKADGALPVVHKDQINILDATPIAQQKGFFELGDSGAKFTDTGTPVGNPNVFNREQQDLRYSMPHIKPDMPTLNPEMLNPSLSGAKPFDGKMIDGSTPIRQSETFDGSTLGKFERMQPYKPEYDKWSRKPEAGEFAVNKVIQGTSFSNVDYLRRNFDRLKELKASN